MFSSHFHVGSLSYLVINVQLVIAICVRKKGAVALNSAAVPFSCTFFEVVLMQFLMKPLETTAFIKKTKTSAPIGKRRFMVKYQYEIRKYFTSKLYVVFTPISTKTSNRNRTNYSRGRLRETPRSFCGGTGSERSVFDLFQSKGKSSEPATDVEDYVVCLP